MDECKPFYELLKRHALRPPALAAPPAAPAPQPVDVGLDAAAPAGGAHQGATHAFAADTRNASVLVGIRDGVRNAFELHARPHARVSVLDSGFVLGDGVWEGLRLRNGVVQFATNAFFFQEGTAARYESARYGEFRVGADGEMLLTGLRDADFQRLGVPDAPP